MKKCLTILILFLSLSIFAQEETNPFAASENNVTEKGPTKDERNDSEMVTMGSPGDPPIDDPIPIDNYIPLLLITAVGIIVYKTRKQKNFN